MVSRGLRQTGSIGPACLQMGRRELISSSSLIGTRRLVGNWKCLGTKDNGCADSCEEMIGFHVDLKTCWTVLDCLGCLEMFRTTYVD